MAKPLADAPQDQVTPIQETREPQNQVHSEPTAHQKPNILLKLGVGVVLILLISITAYLGYQNWQLGQQISLGKPTPTPSVSVTPTQDSTTNWKTYRASTNLSQGKTASYEIRYPEDAFDFVFMKSQGAGEDLMRITSKPIIRNSFSEVEDGLTADIWYVGNDYPKESPTTESKINDISVKRYFSVKERFTIIKYEVPIPNSNEEYIKIAIQAKGIRTDELLTKFDQILSTFKFQSQANTSDTCGIAKTATEGEYAECQIIVGFKDDVSEEQARLVIKSMGLSPKPDVSGVGVFVHGKWLVVVTPKGQEKLYIEKFIQLPQVRYAELDGIARALQ